MKKILLIDDDKDLRALLRTSLGAHGLEVLEAGRARDAERLLQQGPVDVAIVDGLLPDGPGLELVERLRARDSKVRVVFFSAYYRDIHTFRQLTHRLDVSLVLYKPIEPESFAAKVAELAGALAGAAEAGAGDGLARDPHLAAELAKLHRQFTEQLPAKIGVVEEEVAAAKADPRRMARARDLAHALRGSAGSYGFTAVSEAMGVVEYLLADASAQRDLLRPYFWEELQAALREARSVGVRDAAQPPSQPQPAGTVPRPQEGPR